MIMKMIIITVRAGRAKTPHIPFKKPLKHFWNASQPSIYPAIKVFNLLTCGKTNRETCRILFAPQYIPFFIKMGVLSISFRVFPGWWFTKYFEPMFSPAGCSGF